MSALKSANKELKGMMKTVKIEDVDVSNLLLSFKLPYLYLREILMLNSLFFLPVELARWDDGSDGHK